MQEAVVASQLPNAKQERSNDKQSFLCLQLNRPQKSTVTQFIFQSSALSGHTKLVLCQADGHPPPPASFGLSGTPAPPSRLAACTALSEHIDPVAPPPPFLRSRMQDDMFVSW